MGDWGAVKRNAWTMLSQESLQKFMRLAVRPREGSFRPDAIDELGMEKQ